MITDHSWSQNLLLLLLLDSEGNIPTLKCLAPSLKVIVNKVEKMQSGHVRPFSRRNPTKFYGRGCSSPCSPFNENDLEGIVVSADTIVQGVFRLGVWPSRRQRVKCHRRRTRLENLTQWWWRHEERRKTSFIWFAPFHKLSYSWHAQVMAL